MIEIFKYTSDKKQIWDNFVNHSKIPMFMFNRDFMEYHADRYIDFSLMFYENGELIAVLPASLHGKEVRSHGGLTYGGMISGEKMKQHRMNDCFVALHDYLKTQKIEKLLYKKIPYIYYKIPSEEDLYPLLINGARIVRRDISTTIDLEKDIKITKGRKAQITRAKREGVIIIESDDFEGFLELENQVLRERHATQAVHTARELILLKSRFSKQIHLFMGVQGKEILSATLIFEYDTLVHTQYMASSELGRKIGALDLLISTLKEKYCNKKYFDFGISTEQAGKVFNGGLCAQKEGFGGRSVVYDFYEWRIK